MVLVRHWVLEVEAPEASATLRWLTEHNLQGWDRLDPSVNCEALVHSTVAVYG